MEVAYIMELNYESSWYSQRAPVLEIESGWDIRYKEDMNQRPLHIGEDL